MDLDSLQAAVREGQRFEYLLFWGHRQKREGAPDASCLSQWFPARFVIGGDAYLTAEHWMMASKARLFGDDDTLAEILTAPTPARAKQLGRRVRGFDEDAWAARRFDLVVEGNVAKFSQDERLRAFLASTGDRVLVEASPMDRIWGIGLSRESPDAADPLRWRGANLLGFALVEVRRRLRG